MPEIFRAAARPSSQLLRSEKRTSPRLRGYDAKWDGLSRRFRRLHPLCRFCEQAGDRVVLCDVVDHVIPVVDRPDLLHDWANLQSLCHMHHSGLKAWLEAEARAVGNIDLLARWCADPEVRPVRHGEAIYGGTQAKG